MTVEELRKRLVAEGLCFMGYLVLRNVAESPESITALARIATANWETVSNHVDHQVKRGLLLRSAGVVRVKLRKGVMISITEAGKELLGRVEG